MAEGVAKEFRKRFFKNVERFINYTSDTAFDTKEFIRLMDEAKASPKLYLTQKPAKHTSLR